jgi:cell filamentation protein, protein adenylyltransferase
MKRERTGRFELDSTTGETVQGFVPAPLPPAPAVEWSQELQEKFERAAVALGRLDGVSILLPNVSLYLYMHVRKEALLSSQIEGTQSSFSELLASEAKQGPGTPVDEDVEDVSNYVAALYHGLDRLADGFPLCLRLLRDMHGILLRSGRGSDKCPGEFRTSQNWIGGTRPGNATYVPPPPAEMQDCLNQFEKFLHDDPVHTSPLLKAALAHVQFETIHPFLDGNGRLGRILITLLLCEEKVLDRPVLYLSLFLKTHRARYYELLNYVRTTGDWESWLDFYAEAVAETATQAVDTARRVKALADQDHDKIKALGRVSGSVLKVQDAFLKWAATSMKALQVHTGLAAPTVNTCLGHLQELGIVREVTGQKRNRIYMYDEYVGILNEGTENPL